MKQEAIIKMATRQNMINLNQAKERKQNHLRSTEQQDKEKFERFKSEQLTKQQQQY